jgi:hypothetical protein
MTKHTSNHLFPREIEALDIDKSGLRDFYKSDYAALQVLDNLASRENDSHITTVTSIVSRLEGGGHQIKRSDVMRVFRALERFRCGKFIREPTIQSAKTKQSRFEWRVSLVIVGKIARR